jgi:hypothetical protein
MRRDMDLIREILLFTETGQETSDNRNLSRQEVAYHFWLLKDAGYVDALIQRDEKNVPIGFHINSLTWEGHEFLDAMRDDTLWKKAKETFIKPGASWTAKLIFEWLKLELKQRFFGQAGE